MRNKHHKKQISLLIGIFCGISLSLIVLNSTPNVLIPSELAMDVKTATVVNYNSDLVLEWGGTDSENGNGIVIDTSGNIYITGWTKSFGAGTHDAFIAKYDSAGNSLFNITWGDDYSDKGNDITLDGSGNIFMIGQTYNSLNDDVFIAKYDSEGTSVKNATWNSGNNEYGYGIAADSTGNIYITGKTYNGANNDAFVAKYSNSLNIQWIQFWDNGSNDEGYGIALDALGFIYITGGTYNGADYDAFVAKYDNNGNFEEDISLSGSNSDKGHDIVVDGTGNIYITGQTYSFGAGNYDAFIAKYDSAGDLLHFFTWGGIYSDWGYGIGLDATGNYYIVGETTTFSAGNYDGFVAKYDDSGLLEWNEIYDGNYHDMGSDIALDASGNIYIVGDTQKDSYSGKYNAFIARYSVVIDPGNPPLGFLDIFTSLIGLITVGCTLGIGVLIGILISKKMRH